MIGKLLEMGIPKHTAEEGVRKMVETFIKEYNPELLPDSDTEE
jgi:hypothetical protein